MASSSRAKLPNTYPIVSERAHSSSLRKLSGDTLMTFVNSLRRSLSRSRSRIAAAIPSVSLWKPSPPRLRISVIRNVLSNAWALAFRITRSSTCRPGGRPQSIWTVGGWRLPLGGCALRLRLSFTTLPRFVGSKARSGLHSRPRRSFETISPRQETKLCAIHRDDPPKPASSSHAPTKIPRRACMLDGQRLPPDVQVDALWRLGSNDPSHSAASPPLI